MRNCLGECGLSMEMSGDMLTNQNGTEFKMTNPKDSSSPFSHQTSYHSQSEQAMPDKIDTMDDTVNQIVSLLQLMADIAAKLLEDTYTVTTAVQRDFMEMFKLGSCTRPSEDPKCVQ